MFGRNQFHCVSTDHGRNRLIINGNRKSLDNEDIYSGSRAVCGRNAARPCTWYVPSFISYANPKQSCQQTSMLECVVAFRITVKNVGRL